MISPYVGLPSRAYWRTGVTERRSLDASQFYLPKFEISKHTKVATAGSCFAQHVGRALRLARINVLDAEPLSADIPNRTANDFGYNLFSARYGNIYTAAQLKQLSQEATGDRQPTDFIWLNEGRYFDALRPSVEPRGLETPELVVSHRQHHLIRVLWLLKKADLFVFTFGLTETWRHRDDGTVYPTAPGTMAGSYDPEIYEFHNSDYEEVLRDFLEFRSIVKRLNPEIKFLLTVSPVPLTATASGQHVEVATSYSKAVLRSVCGKLLSTYQDIEYFPSFEVITSQTARGQHYKANQRSITQEGVSAAMNLFLSAHNLAFHASRSVEIEGDERCEEGLLEAFAK